MRSALLHIVLLLFPLAGVLELLHALTQATHEFGDLLAAEEKQQDHHDKNDLPWADDTEQDGKGGGRHGLYRIEAQR